MVCVRRLPFAQATSRATPRLSRCGASHFTPSLDRSLLRASSNINGPSELAGISPQEENVPGVFSAHSFPFNTQSSKGVQSFFTAAVERGPSQAAHSGSKESSARPCTAPSVPHS